MLDESQVPSRSQKRTELVAVSLCGNVEHGEDRG
jgi:hypothetical protein